MGRKYSVTCTEIRPIPFLMSFLIKKYLPAAMLAFSLLLVATSCNNAKEDKSLIVPVKKTDFENVLTVQGTVQAVRSYAISHELDDNCKIVYLIEEGTMVEAGQVVCVLESNALETEYDELLLNIENNEAALSKTRADLDLQYSLLEAQVKNSDAQSGLAALDSLQMQYLSPNQKKLKELDLERIAIERKKLQLKLASLKTINESQLKKQELQLQRQRQRLETAKENLEALTLVSPIAGMANRGLSWMTGLPLQEGDQAYSSMPIVTIPDLTEVKVTIEASESEYKRLQINDSVAFVFDAMPGKTAWGRILTIAPVGRQISRTNPLKVFDVEVSVEEADKLPKPGLSANCRIYLKRIPDVLAIPQIAVFDQDSIKVVYVKHGKTYEERQVLVGESSPQQAVILAGLKEKEQLSLLKPPASNVKKHTKLPSAIIKQYQRTIDSLQQVEASKRLAEQPDEPVMQAYGETSPTTGTTRPMGGQARPMGGQARPMGGQARPMGGQARPMTGPNPQRQSR